MIDFIKEQPLLILGLLGAVVGFIASITKIFGKKEKTRIVLWLAIVGFVILLMQQLIKFNQDQTKKVVQAQKDAIISEIKNNVFATRNIVEEINLRLNSYSIDKIGQSLVTVESTENLGNSFSMAAFSKGSTSMWRIYADWLEQDLEDDVYKCLAISLNANRHYVTNLLLLYLMTDKKTRPAIQSIVNDYSQWQHFPKDEFLQEFGLIPVSVKYVLFFDNDMENLIAYANAKNFAEELLLYYHSGLSDKVEYILNDNSSDYLKQLSEMFPSVSTKIYRQNEPAEIVKNMLEQQIAEVAVVHNGQKYLVNLEKVIRLVTTSS